MKILDILLENAPSKSIVGAILKNSNLLDSPDKETAIAEINRLFPRFRQIQGQLNPNLPQVITFLNHFDGNHGTTRFEPEFLKDITKYNLNQLRFLIGEYDPDEDGEIGEPENLALVTQTNYTDELADESKKLWFNESTAKIDLPGFRVYQPLNQRDSIKYGWYVEKIKRELAGGALPWCVTWRGENNRWEYYRKSMERTFYFVIDESKAGTPYAKYYLGAFQVLKNSLTSKGKDYILTSSLNDGDREMSWSEITTIYPQLADYRSELRPLEFNQAEIEMRGAMSNINEIPGNPNNFSRSPYRYKKEYINLGLVLTKPESWMSMTNELRERYIVLTERGQYTSRFPNFEFLRAVKKTGQGKILDSTIKRKEGNEGIKSLTQYLMRDLQPMEEKSGIKNPNILLYKTRKNKYGLWDNKTSDWLQKGNSTYEPAYSLVDEEVLQNDDTGELFYVDKYSYSSSDYFVAVTPLEEQVFSYFLSNNAWEKIKDKFSKEPTEKDVDVSQDIYEIKKGD